MANSGFVDSPCGLKPYGTILRKQWYKMSAGSGAIYQNDAVYIANTGSASLSALTASLRLVGSALAFTNSTHVPIAYNPANTAGYVLIADDPEQLFVIQEDSDSASLALTAVGCNCTLISTHSGSTTSGRGKMELDSTTATGTGSGVGGSLQIRILKPLRDNVYGSWNRWICNINLHQYNNNARGAIGGAKAGG